MKKVTKYFFEGLLLLVPLFVTLYVFYFIFTRIDSFFHLKVPGLGFGITILMIIGVGFVSSNLLTSNFVSRIDAGFSRLPFVKMIYNAMKDLTNAFVGDKKRFNRPVLVELVPGGDARVVGFITGEDLSALGLQEYVSVYLPQSYNFAGYLVLVPASRVMPLDLDSGQVMAFIVSGGVASPVKEAVEAPERTGR